MYSIKPSYANKNKFSQHLAASLAHHHHHHHHHLFVQTDKNINMVIWHIAAEQKETDCSLASCSWPVGVALLARREVAAVADVTVVEAATVSEEISTDVSARRTAHVRRQTGIALAVVRVTAAVVAVEVARRTVLMRRRCTGWRDRDRTAVDRLDVVAADIVARASRRQPRELDTNNAPFHSRHEPLLARHAICRTPIMTRWWIVITYSTVYVHTVRSTNRNLLAVPRHRLNTYSGRAFAVAGPTVWNSLPDFIRDPSISTDSFRRLLKTYLFARY